MIIISLFIFVFDFYVEQTSIVKFDRVRTCYYGTLMMIIGGLITSIVWMKNEENSWLKPISPASKNEDHQLSGGVVFAVVMFSFATDLLSSPIKQRSGAFIGYAADGSRLYKFPQERSQSIMLLIRSSLRDVLAETDSRQIFYFLCINLVSKNEYLNERNSHLKSL